MYTIITIHTSFQMHEPRRIKKLATQFINLITSKLHSYKETEAHLLCTKAGKKNSSLKSARVTLDLSEVEEISQYFLVDRLGTFWKAHISQSFLFPDGL